MATSEPGTEESQRVGEILAQPNSLTTLSQRRFSRAAGRTGDRDTPRLKRAYQKCRAEEEIRRFYQAVWNSAQSSGTWC